MQKSFFRNFVALIFAAVILYRERPKVTFTPKSKRHLFWRAFFGTVGVLCNFYAVDHLVLADASMLNKMSPFFAVIFAIFLLKEKPNHFQTLSIITAFIGVLFIVKPTGNMNLIPALIGLMGGLGAGLAYTYVRSLGQQGVAGPFIVFFFSAFSCVVLLPFLIFDFHPMTWVQLGTLLFAGLSPPAVSSPSLPLTATHPQGKFPFSTISRFPSQRFWASSYSDRFLTGSAGSAMPSSAAQPLPCFCAPPGQKRHKHKFLHQKNKKAGISTKEFQLSSFCKFSGILSILFFSFPFSAILLQNITKGVSHVIRTNPVHIAGIGQ